MRRFIFPIIKKRKEEKEREDRRVPLYRRAPEGDLLPKEKPLDPKNKYIEIDFNIDQFDINNEMKL